MDVNGRSVDTAGYSHGAWQIAATGYDQQGNTTWTLAAGNRAQALNPTGSTDPYVAAQPDSADRAALLSTVDDYSPDGLELTDKYGPMHPVQLADGSTIDARSHTHTSYDQNSPNGTTYDLPTTSVVSAQDSAGIDHDPVTSHTGYAPIETGDASGWLLRQPTSTTAQLGTSPSSNDPVTITRYNDQGQVIEQRLPGDAAAGHAGSTLTSYYTATGTGDCVSPAQAGLPCTTGPAAQPASGKPLATTRYTYNQYGDVTTKIETAGATVRTSTIGYDTADRPVSSSITVSPTSAGGTALPTVHYSYDKATGLPTTTSTTSGSSTTSLTTGYDNLGRTTSYTDATGITSTTSYDIDGRPVSSFDGKATSSYSYDPTTGQLTGEDTGASPSPSAFSATYTLDGRLASETYPNGLVATYTYDNTGSPTSLTYAKSGTTWLAFTATPNAQGQTAAATSPASSQAYSYDGTGRLTTVQDTVQNPSNSNLTCTTRVYGFDANSNRTSLAAYPDGGTDPSTGDCSTSTTPVTASYNYDQADRLTSDTAGSYSYDTLGRTTTVPAGDAQGIGSHTSTTGDLTIGYYANDYVASETQGSTTQTFGLDPLQNREATSTTGSTTQVFHYSDNTDSPTWSTTGTGDWTRNITGIDGGLAATQSSTGTPELQLTNLHGDIVATCADTATATSTDTYSENTEYGQPRTAADAPNTYGWLGAKQRTRNDLGGLTLMGIRLYNPATGRFLQTDPVYGGNTDAYTYPINPINAFDLTGQCWSGFGWVCGAYHWVRHIVARAYHWVSHHYRLLRWVAVGAIVAVGAAAICVFGGCELAAAFFAADGIAVFVADLIGTGSWFGVVAKVLLHSRQIRRIARWAAWYVRRYYR